MVMVSNTESNDGINKFFNVSFTVIKQFSYAIEHLCMAYEVNFFFLPFLWIFIYQLLN